MTTPSLAGILSLLPEPFATFSWIRDVDGRLVSARATGANPAAEALGIVPGSEWTEPVADFSALDGDADAMDGHWSLAGDTWAVKAWRVPGGFSTLWRPRQPVQSPRCPPAQTEAVYEAMDEGVAVFDASGRQLWHNRAQARHFGFSETDDLSGNLKEFSRQFELRTLDGTLVPVEKWPAARVLRGETLTDLELRVRRSDVGKDWIITFSGKPVPDPHGGPPFALVISRNVTERHATRAALERSEDRYRTLFDSIEDGFCIAEMISGPDGRTVDYRIIEGNPAYVEATGLRDSIGRTVREMVPDIEPFWIETYGRVARTGEPARFESRVAAWDRWFEVYAFRFGPAERNQVAIFFRNITARKKAEQTQAEVLATLKLAQEAGRIGTFDWDVTRDLNRWSPELEALYGLPPGGFGGSYAHWLALVHPDDRSDAGQLALDALKGGLFETEFRIVRPDGQIRWLAARAEIDRDEDGRPVRMIGINMDITERQRAAEALRRSQENLDRATRAGSVGIWSWNVTTGEVEWSDLMWEIFGRTPDDGPKPMQVFETSIQPKDKDRVFAKTAELMQPAGPSDFREEFRIIRPDGSVRWIESVAKVERDSHGQVVSVNGVNIDITDRRMLAEQLREADRRKDEFLAMLAHELRNPLAAVSNAVHLLGLRGNDADIRHTCVEALGRQTRHLSRLIDDLMDVNRLSQGKLALHIGEVDLTAVIRQAVEVVRPLYRVRRQRMDVRIPTGPVHIQGDSARLIQAIGNLLNNACKFSNPDDVISITLTSKAGRALITVDDPGIGISPDQIDGIFELFQQFHGTTHRENSGLGIGLSLVRRLVELHGGTVRASSPGLGKGSSFVVDLPLPSASESVRPSPPGENMSAPAVIPRRVLFVDDNQDTTAAMAGVLRALGHETLVAHDGLSAVSTALRKLPEVVILDIGLPGIDGNEAARRIRSGWPVSQPMPLLVALTGWGQPSDRERSTAAGFDRHLVKPVDFETLEALFAEAGRV